MSNKRLLVLVILTKILILAFTPSFFSDLGYYFDLSGKMVSGDMPYIDFTFEYPPLAIIPIWLPALILKNFFLFSRENYIALFRFLFFFMDVLFLILIHKKYSQHKFYRRFLLIYAGCSLPLATLLYDRLDLFFGFMVFGSLHYCGHQKIKALFWSLIGIPYKLISLIFLPYILVTLFFEKNLKLKTWMKWIFLPIIGLSLVSYDLFDFEFLNFLNYHRIRGVQVESIWSSLYYILLFFSGQKIALDYSFGAQHVKYIPDWILFLANYSIIFILIFFFLAFLFKKIPLDEILLTSLLAFLCFSKVLSPQYLIWFLPLMIFFIDQKLELSLFMLSCFLSGLIFMNYGDFIALKPWTWWALNIRNLLLMFWLGIRIKKMAEMERFELSNGFHHYTLSKRAHSTALTHLRSKQCSNIS